MGGPGSGPRKGTNSKGRPGAKGNIPINTAIIITRW